MKERCSRPASELWHLYEGVGSDTGSDVQIIQSDDDDVQIIGSDSDVEVIASAPAHIYGRPQPIPAQRPSAHAAATPNLHYTSHGSGVPATDRQQGARSHAANRAAAPRPVHGSDPSGARGGAAGCGGVTSFGQAQPPWQPLPHQLRRNPQELSRDRTRIEAGESSHLGPDVPSMAALAECRNALLRSFPDCKLHGPHYNHDEYLKKTKENGHKPTVAALKGQKALDLATLLTRARCPHCASGLAGDVYRCGTTAYYQGRVVCLKSNCPYRCSSTYVGRRFEQFLAVSPGAVAAPGDGARNAAPGPLSAPVPLDPAPVKRERKRRLTMAELEAVDPKKAAHVRQLSTQRKRVQRAKDSGAGGTPV